MADMFKIGLPFLKPNVSRELADFSNTFLYQLFDIGFGRTVTDGVPCYLPE
jgi:hypothetical protein